ncbi:MAG: FHA domain-containing protein [Bacteriovorax sp.]|nr:FHA domain-containing protein [Bacteriovorax sp.]
MKLSVLKRNQPIQKIDLGKDVLAFDYSETVFLIGRSKDCHVVLDDKQVSREHVRIIHKNGKWLAEKTAEHNACLHNGEEFNRAELDDGDSLTIGSFTINIENSSENTVEFSAATTPVPVINPIVEAQSAVTTNIATATVVTSSAVPATRQDSDATREIDPTELTNEIPNPLLASSGEATSDIELPSDFESSDQSSKNENDEFNYEENTEHEAEVALGLNSDSQAEEQNSMMESDENLSYSLENIDSGNDDESTKVIQSFSKVQLELFGETAPYDKYLIESEKTYIGRDASKCQIVLNDSEVSSIHAVITKNNIMITLEDLNSSNGTILNGDRINKATLNHNDEFVIGGVTFTVKVRSDFLKEESSTLMAVDENQTVEVEEVVEVQAEEGENLDALGGMISDGPLEKSILKRIWKDEEKRKKLIYGAVILVGAWVMFGDDSSTKPPVTTTNKPKKAIVKTETSINKFTGKKLNEDERRALSARYEIGKNHYYNGRYREALDEFQKISATDPNFNSSLQSLMALSKEGLSKLEEQEKKRIAEQTAAEKKIKVKELVERATGFVKDRRVELAQDVFNEIAKIDPENIDVTKMKLELEDWQKEKAKKELEEASKKKAREDKVEKLKPGKALFIQKEWFKTIGKLDDFLKIKDMDEDLTKEASEMLKTSRDEISAAVAPLIGKAKSLMEGQDLKGAYEVYQQILKIEPSNAESLNSTGEIKEQLSNKARKIYREAIISESLSLFQDAKEKFQEVQQVSPVDSDYYKKASDKLKDYLE